MRNLVPYKDDCFEVHKEAVKRKEDKDLKVRLDALNPIIEKEYITYDSNFATNTLGLVSPNASLDKSKSDLQKLYSYQSKVIRTVRKKIKDLQVNTIVSTCQNCTVDSANTLDHILPQSAFPAFVVNPKNLFPCCSTCNDYKLISTNTGGSQFLNLYLDELPEQQYLFVNVSLNANRDLEFKFYLDNPNNIDIKLFGVIKNHFERLHLFERMNLKAIEHLSEFTNLYKGFLKTLIKDDIVEILKNTAEENKKAYGFNYWKSVLEFALLNDTNFLSI